MKPVVVVLTCAVMLQTLPAFAWWPQGHSVLTSAALKSLPNDVPAFLRNDAGLAAHGAQDPDVAKNRDLPHITAREEPEHFIDLELLKGNPLPPTREAFVALCFKNNIDPNDVGYVPYTIAEWTERLTIALAEHRKWPDNSYIQSKCQLYAGILAHYAGDIGMPLHTTVDYDGRVRPDGKSSRTGIHAKVDSLIEKVRLKPEDLAKDQKVEPIPDPVATITTTPGQSRRVLIKGLMPAILQEMQGSRALINRTYELEAQLPPAEGDWKPSAEILAFTTERARAGTRFIATLYLTAWRKSAEVQLPRWLIREATPVANPAPANR